MPSPVLASAPAAGEAWSVPAVGTFDDPQATARKPAVSKATRGFRWCMGNCTCISLRAASKGFLNDRGEYGLAVVIRPFGHMQPEYGARSGAVDELERAAVGASDRSAKCQAETCATVLR